VDGLAKLTSLTNLDLSECESLQNVDGLAKLTNLAYLNLGDCKKIKTKPSGGIEKPLGPEEIAAYQVQIKDAMMEKK